MSKALTDWKLNHPGRIPGPVRSMVQMGLRATSYWRPLPSFLVIGFQKCSTTSLYSHLALHPQVQVSHRKEIDYFGCDTGQDLAWYRSHFPMRRSKTIAIGEASTMYAYMPQAPAEAKLQNPKFKLIAVLRDPVKRTISHYHHRRKWGLEERTIDQAIEDAFHDFDKDIATWQDAARPDADPSRPYREPKASYLIRSMYSLQIENWKKLFAPEQLLLIQAEDFWSRSEDVFHEVESFLGIDHHGIRNNKVFNQGAYQKGKPDSNLSAIQNRLTKHFQGEYQWCREQGLTFSNDTTSDQENE
ncbi:Sulfotransferase domain protein [Rubripirellula amarantea]|uniref:Sulfotransferase domain protein n=1 Tax=Rubripirellula amarantea TaxID=2527999 RepID=A0A5C5WS90_9BACT|nr:sulfotransferase domain-containing protein [Rubripirellula amarantea]TWT52642.1 Sulfotransferase domain protein [Rubripirellula amarantea]